MGNGARGAVVRDGRWLRAEQTIQEIIWQVQPNVPSETRRKSIIDYVSKLIKKSTGAEVLPFGSVPFRAYLPDGDIDLSVILGCATAEALANAIRSVLEVEEQNEDAVFKVKDIQYINAEVKLVKCTVQNIVVDISFNQIGGLYTLWFLEKADAVIGQDHLFKRSIILIKSWCYYESHILGAHHGLFSTYALEILILYIIHVFHSSLDGPLEVLYKFLAYFGEFDWDKFCIGLHGPIHLSSLPTLDGGTSGSNQMFRKKHLNIFDPLKQNNNLGRSVSAGNSHRIRKALKYGARELESILMLPPGEITSRLKLFFMNTLGRHDTGRWEDLQDAFPSNEDNEPLQGEGSGSSPVTTGSHGALAKETKNVKLSATKKEQETRVLSDGCLTNDAVDITTNKLLVSRTVREAYKVCNSGTGSTKGNWLDSRTGNHTLPMRISVSDSSDSQDNRSSRGPAVWSPNSHGISDSASLSGLDMSSSQNLKCGKNLELESSSTRNGGGATNSIYKPVNLLDLDGDVELHLYKFQCARQCLEGMNGTDNHPSLPAHFDHEELWNALRRRNTSFCTKEIGVIQHKFSPPGAQQSNQLDVSGKHGTNTRKMKNRHNRRGASHGYYNNNQAAAFSGEYLTKLESQEAPLLMQLPVCGLDDHMKVDIHHTLNQRSREGNGFILSPYTCLEFGSLGPVPLGAFTPELPIAFHVQGIRHNPPLTVQRPGSSAGFDRPAQFCGPKDESDFPPVIGRVLLPIAQ